MHRRFEVLWDLVVELLCVGPLLYRANFPGNGQFICAWRGGVPGTCTAHSKSKIQSQQP